MNLFDKFNQTFGFTRQESRVVWFLVLTLIVGMGIRLFKASTSSKPKFDYSASDSEFAARSQVISAQDSLSTGEEGTDSQSNPAATRPSSTTSPKLISKSININTATKDELVQLPGIGEAMAERIILYREENGPFETIDELTNVKGIGKRKLERIASFCTLGK